MNVEVVKEVRFAIVLFGGVSLAIYINGVAQEIFRLVRATSTSDGGGEWLLNESELDEADTQSLYRDLAYLAGDVELIEDTALLDNMCDGFKEGGRGRTRYE